MSNRIESIKIAVKIREIENNLVKVRYCNDMSYQERMRAVWELQLKLRAAYNHLIQAVETETSAVIIPMPIQKAA
jgi:hypothetical protein